LGGQTNGVSGAVTVDATRRQSPADENIADLSLVSSAISAPSLGTICFGPTGSNSAQLTSLTGTVDLTSGDLDVTTTGEITNAIFTGGNPLTFTSFQAGVMDFGSGVAQLQTMAKDFLPTTIDSNGDGAPNACLAGTDVPTVSDWGLVVMLLLVGAAGTVVITRRSAIIG
jgi:hypothetical protein